VNNPGYRDLGIAHLSNDPSISIRELAKKIGCGKDKLYRDDDFMELFNKFQTLHSQGKVPRKGTKEGGRVEAVDSDD
jgi:hypothetical protein